MSLDGLNLSALVAELDEKITGSRIDRIVQLDKYTLCFSLRQNNQTNKLIVSANPEQVGAYLTEENLESPLQPPSFCMLLRKHLEDGRIGVIRQQELDRVIIIDIDTLGPQGLIVTKRLVFEIMGKHSNLIFIKDGIIIDALRRIGPNLSRFRQILPGQTYQPPPGQEKFNLLTGSLPDFWSRYSALPEVTAEKAFVGLAFGIGPLTAKDWIWQAGLPAKILVKDLDQSDFSSLTEVVENAITAFRAKEFTPTVCTDSQNRLLTITALPPAKRPSDAVCCTFSTMSEAIAYLHKLRPVRLMPERDTLLKQVTAELQKGSRKAEKLTEEIITSQNADVLKQKGDILMAFLGNIELHSREVTLPDFYQGENASITIPLAPDRSPIENAQAYYTAYHKQKRAQNLLAEQLRQCENEEAYLETVQLALQQVNRNNDIEEIRQELVAAGYIKPSGRRQSLPPAKPLLFSLSPEVRILIGKNNKQNDILTFKTAKIDDLWFHAKDIPGSHVILQSDAPPSDEAIELAAAFAAYFSKAKESDKVPVDYTKRRYVKKPSGAKPGFVIYEKQTTVYVTPAREKAELLQKSK